MVKLAAAIACASVLLGASCRSPSLSTADGFDGPSLSDLWTTRKFVAGALDFQSDVTRAGRGAARLTLRPGDHVPGEEGSSLERAELEEARSQESALDATYRYEFSVFLPPDFPIVSRLVFAQWKERCLLEDCTPDNPTLAIRYEGGRLLITHQTGETRQTLYETADDIRGRWLDFRFDIRFSRSTAGVIRAWLGNRQLVSYTGVNAYSESGGYGDRFYFKMGLYRDRLSEPMVIYLDEYRKQRLPDGS